MSKVIIHLSGENDRGRLCSGRRPHKKPGICQNEMSKLTPSPLDAINVLTVGKIQFLLHVII